jgi:hypothetical protein
VQGRLRKESLSVTIDTVCAHCHHPIEIKIDGQMNCEVKSVFFWSEEHAREHLSRSEQVKGLYLTMDQAVYSIPISQGALFAFK